jgi:hypothetical protein
MRVVEDNWSKTDLSPRNYLIFHWSQPGIVCHGSIVRTVLSELVRPNVSPFVLLLKNCNVFQWNLLIVFVVTHLSQCVSLRTIEVKYAVPCRWYSIISTGVNQLSSCHGSAVHTTLFELRTPQCIISVLFILLNNCNVFQWDLNIVFVVTHLSQCVCRWG